MKELKDKPSILMAKLSKAESPTVKNKQNEKEPAPYFFSTGILYTTKY